MANLGDYFSQGLWGGVPLAPSGGPPDPRFAQLAPQQIPMPQIELNTVVPNAPPQISGNVAVPMPTGELFASGRYQPSPRPVPPSFNLGYRWRF
jgi:hypothetical protein